MDDRFDIMLTSYALDPQMIPSSYTAYGNDGNHFNDSINRPPNTAVSQNVADAIHYSSDHIPVFAKFIFAQIPLSVQLIEFNALTKDDIVKIIMEDSDRS